MLFRQWHALLFFIQRADFRKEARPIAFRFERRLTENFTVPKRPHFIALFFLAVFERIYGLGQRLYRLDRSAAARSDVDGNVLRGDLEHPLLGVHREDIRHGDVIGKQNALSLFERRDAHALAIAVQRIDLRRDDPLEAAVRSRRHDLALAVDLGGEDHAVALLHVHAAHTARDASLRGDVVLFGVQAHSARGDEEHRFALVGNIRLHAHDRVFFGEFDGLEGVLGKGIFAPCRLFEHTLGGDEEKFPLLGGGGEYGDGLFALLRVLDKIGER